MMIIIALLQYTKLLYASVGEVTIRIWIAAVKEWRHF